MLLSVILLAVPGLHAQTLSIQKQVITAGGGTSSSGSYTVNGSIAQSASQATSQGGRYVIKAGFWNQIILVQTPDAPLLSLRRTESGFELFWPGGASGFVLEETGSLSGSISWSSVTQPPALIDGEYRTSIPLVSGSRFYRLRHP